MNDRDVLLGALYHPPRPTYQPSSLLDYLAKCTDALNIKFSAALVILAGDFNTLDDTDVISRTALCDQDCWYTDPVG